MDWVHDRKVLPLPGATFGRLIDVDDAETFVGAVERAPDVLPALLCEAGGLLVLKGMGAISGQPELLVRLSHPFGTGGGGLCPYLEPRQSPASGIEPDHPHLQPAADELRAA